MSAELAVHETSCGFCRSQLASWIMNHDDMHDDVSDATDHAARGATGKLRLWMPRSPRPPPVASRGAAPGRNRAASPGLVVHC